ncbi:hypothetical protein [Quadrisphaera sp. INWT6]|uniref:hypothetical protein n=1 Tax=Quadrisphaera sp. INWT6 TaxID=2596917 RepID=UPI0018926D35|nr:hypothetical protein [Quadrisphaera sp. INWT6]MBF5083056.1 hypothetical protein [Quadrisphaera sp. INWT6]
MPTPLVPPPRRTPGAHRHRSVTYARAHDPARLQNRRRRRQMVVLAVIAVVFPATALSAWNVLRDGENAGGAPPTAEQSAAPDGASQSPAPSSTSDLTWVDHQGTPLPASAAAGPASQDGPLDVGYADTDLGAVLAAVHISYAAGPSAGSTTFRAALENQVTGPAQQALSVAVEKDYAEARVAVDLRDGQPLPPGDATLLGYTVEQLPQGNRHVQLVLTSAAADGSPQVFSVDVVMIRQDDDWCLLAPSAGTWNSIVTQLPDVPMDLTRFDPAQPPTGGGD